MLSDRLLFDGRGQNNNTNRKITNKRRGLEDEVPEYIEGIPKELDFFIPEEEGEEDFSPFTELLEEAEDEEMEGEEEPEVINSSERRQSWPRMNRKEQRTKTIRWREFHKKNQMPRKERSS